MHKLQSFLDNINAYIWGSAEVRPWFTIVLLVGTGIYLTIRLKLIQFVQFKHAFDIVRGKFDDPDDEGDVTHFQALSTALSATIGIGISAISAFCLVGVLEVSRGPIEFEVLGFKFRGASGPVTLWILCFLAIIFALWLLWDIGA